MAARFWVGGGSSTNWSATSNTNWSATSGGANNATVPGATDDVTFNGVGVNANGASVISAALTILSFTATSGYTNSITNNAATSGLSVAGNFTDNTAHTWAGTGQLTITSASTITSGGQTYPNTVVLNGAVTYTLSGDWTVGNLSRLTNTATMNNNNVNVTGSFVNNVVTSGTTKIVMTGTGSVTGTGNMGLSMDINTSGTITIGNFTKNGGTFTYVTGTVNITAATVVNLNSSNTVNTNGINFLNVTIAVAGTLTINSLLTVTDTLTISASVAVTFAGTSGFTTATFSLLHVTTTTITFKNGITYLVSTALSGFSSRNGASLTLASDDGTLKFTLTLSPTATCNVLANITRCDASGGRPIWTFNGTVTSCNNVFTLQDAYPPNTPLIRKAVSSW